MKSTTLVAIVLVVGSLLQGCGMITTTIVNETVSSLTGKDCAVQNAFKDKPFCSDVGPMADTKPPVYCFRTLGQIDCYAEANPYEAGKLTNQRNPSPMMAGNDSDRELPQTPPPALEARQSVKPSIYPWSWPGTPKPI